MIIIALGDIHGHANWKAIIAAHPFDKIILLGDYFDSRDDLSIDQQIENFKNIIAYKKSNPEKVILLFGNHDYHYLRSAEEHYSGYQVLFKIDISELIHRALDENLLQMCFVYENFVFTHAGITKTWCRENNVDLQNMEQSINDLFRYKPDAFKFTRGENNSHSGNDVTQSPIWVRPESLLADLIPGFIQVVGHTTQHTIKQINNEEGGIILIDTLGMSGEFLVIENKIPVSKKLSH